ncbi:GNAT family N-acetyltransferase [Pedobacter frigoris]|uniref:GNAT family N-acetyltransferase n=1 Tax=Pedobacter frigoris TaxID=2571272 RepID=UPI00292E4C22|nr:GNAT family N-acetyltransferase [Pedobacter frigoris]
MNAEYLDLPLVKNESKSQFELEIDGHTALIVYKEHGKKIWLIHTESPAELQGKGAATAIIEKTLAYIEENGYRLIPLCPFVVAYMKRHTEWNRVLDESVTPF